MAVASRREDLVYLHGHDRSSGGPAGFETVLRARSEVCKETEIEAWRRRPGKLNGRVRRRRRSLNLPNRWEPQTAVRSARGGRPSTGWCASEPDGANGWINAMNESPDPAAQKWVNTDAGRTIIGASIVGVFMIITAAAVLIGGQANQSQSGPSTGSQTATPTNPTPAPATPPVPPSAPAPSGTTAAPAPPAPPPDAPSAPTHTYQPTYAPTTAPSSAAPSSAAPTTASSSAAPTTSTTSGPSQNITRGPVVMSPPRGE